MTAPAPADHSPARRALLEVDRVKVYFPGREGLFARSVIRAVDDVSLTLARGETLGLVGESGSGKSTLGRAIVQVEPVDAGDIRLDGRSLLKLRGTALRRERRRFQMVFQDPYASLNPRHRIGDIVGEALETQRLGNSAMRRTRVAELLQLVGLDAAYAERYPYALSGGQRQRVAIARALVAKPELIVCDEVVSALDVSVRAQIINLLERVQSDYSVAYLFIAHDLAVVRHIADRVAVMYLGKIVESRSSDELYDRPLHPYTRALISAVPIADVDVEQKRSRIILRGDIPSPSNPPSGCGFRTRCPWAQQRCADVEPPLRPAGDGVVACHFWEEIQAGAPPNRPLVGSPSPKC